MLLPAAALILALVVYPIATMVHLSFQDVKLMTVNAGNEPEYTLANFQRIFTDHRMIQTFQVTAIFVIGSTLLAFGWGLATALLLDREFHGRTAVRMLIISPWAVASVVASLTWMFLLNSETGLLNYLLLSAGLSDRPINFLGNAGWALPTVIFVSAWKSYPFFTVMFMAGLKAVPKDALDAAKIDGAGSVTSFFWVTMPALRPVIAVSLPLSLLSAFREIETILVLTGGGPGRATETASLAIYNRAFQYFEVGRASALGVVVFVLCLTIVFGALRLLQDNRHPS
jgi:multiple sugar transport system permease protein